jgi:hypothetical protein
LEKLLLMGLWYWQVYYTGLGHFDNFVIDHNNWNRNYQRISLPRD